MSDQRRTELGGITIHDPVSEWLGGMAGGSEVQRFLEKNPKNYLVVGGVAEQLRGGMNPGLVAKLHQWWEKSEIPKGQDVDLIAEEADPGNWEGEFDLKGVPFAKKVVGERASMLLVGTSIPQLMASSIDKLGGRPWFESSEVWAEIVATRRRVNSDTLARMGYSPFTSVGRFCPGSGEIEWIGVDRFVSGREIIGEGVDFRDNYNRSIKLLRMALKSVVNCCLRNEFQPNASRLTDWLVDRVETVRGCWTRLVTEARKDGSWSVVGGEDGLINRSLPNWLTTEGEATAWLDVVYKMFDGWVLMGDEATEVYRRTGVLAVVFGKDGGGGIKELVKRRLEEMKSGPALFFNPPVQAEVANLVAMVDDLPVSDSQE